VDNTLVGLHSNIQS